MKYTLRLYKNTSENSDVEKHLTDMREIEGINRVAIDTLRPVIDINGLNVNEYNYCYIVELKRYYYIENVIIDPNGISRLTMRVDVLMSYVEDIKASYGLITKQHDYNPYFGDYDVESRTVKQRYDFKSAFDENGEFILVALRG